MNYYGEPVNWNWQTWRNWQDVNDWQIPRNEPRLRTWLRNPPPTMMGVPVEPMVSTRKEEGWVEPMVATRKEADWDGALVELLSCSICLELFSEPRILGCGHSFCRKCLDSLSQSVRSLPNRQTFFACPLCRYRVRMHLYPRYMPINRALVDVIAQYWVHRRAQEDLTSSSSQAQASFNSPCDDSFTQTEDIPVTDTSFTQTDPLLKSTCFTQTDPLPSSSTFTQTLPQPTQESAVQASMTFVEYLRANDSKVACSMTQTDTSEVMATLEGQGPLGSSDGDAPRWRRCFPRGPSPQVTGDSQELGPGIIHFSTSPKEVKRPAVKVKSAGRRLYADLVEIMSELLPFFCSLLILVMVYHDASIYTAPQAEESMTLSSLAAVLVGTGMALVVPLETIRRSIKQFGVTLRNIWNSIKLLPKGKVKATPVTVSSDPIETTN